VKIVAGRNRRNLSLYRLGASPMSLSRLRVLLFSSLVLALTACAGNAVAPPAPSSVQAPGPAGAPNSGQTAMISLSRGDHPLPLPPAYDGTISVGQNAAPVGATAQVTVTESGSTETIGMSRSLGLSTSTPTDPFPILINIRLPFMITLPLFGFTIHLPSDVNLTGTFDVAFFDPTQPINPALNPEALGTLVARDHRLTFTPPPGTTVTFMPNVVYTLSIARDVSGSYAGAAASILLPAQSGTAQPLASAGPLGADVTYQTGTGTGFLQWQTITGAPGGVPHLIRGNQPTESLVVSASQPITLMSVTVTADFANGSVAPSSGSSGPGTFVPDANPKIFGPFPATVSGSHATFTVTPDSPIQLGSNKAWDFSLVTVTVCVPANTFQPCDSPSGANVLTSVPLNSGFDVLVSDQSGLLKAPYTISATPPCSTAGVNQGDNNGDNPPGYNDLGIGPKTELDVNAGSSGTCTLTVSFNGVPVASTTVAVGESASARSLHPLALRPPINGAAGYAIGGTH
jgi:hypothetical protein